MTREEKIEFIINSSPHTEQEVKSLSRGMNDESIDRWYQVEVYNTERQLEDAILEIA